MKICIPLIISLLSPTYAFVRCPSRGLELSRGVNHIHVVRLAAASEVDDDQEEEVWTEDDFWAAEKARQARLSGSSPGSDDDSAGFQFIIDDNDDNNEENSGKKGKGSAWDQMHPLARLKIIEKRQQRAIDNKKKNESSKDKKRRLMMTYKHLQVRKERDRRAANRVERPIPLYEMSADGDVSEKKLSSQRVEMSALEVGQERKGTVISLQKFGVYVDVASTRDALLHISDMKNDGFVEHPRQLFSPGDDVTVWIKYVDAENNKLAVTMVAPSEEDEGEDDDDLIQLDEVDVDDELWGVVKRVTDYGAYVNLGAVVDGFLHFMDHPDFGINKGAHPSEYLKSGQRIRVWVSDIDDDLKRIELTGNRPTSLPVIRRSIISS